MDKANFLLCFLACGAVNYSGAGWTSLQFYSYGAFTFIAKSSNTSGNLISFFTPLISLLLPLSPLSPRTTLFSYFNSIAGTALTLGVVGAGNGAEQIVFVLGGATPSAFSATSWHLGENILQGSSPLPFDASQVHFSFPSFPSSFSLVLPRSPRSPFSLVRYLFMNSFTDIFHIGLPQLHVRVHPNIDQIHCGQYPLLQYYQRGSDWPLRYPFSSYSFSLLAFSSFSYYNCCL